MGSQTSEMVGRVNPAQRFDADALLRYAIANVDGFPQSPSQFTISQFGHGQSNPTFLVEVHSGSVVKRYVMRKKPPGKLLESAHAVEREFQVLFYFFSVFFVSKFQGKPWPAANWKFYVAFSLFRGASIYAGVHCRWILGNASGGERARNAGKKADAMIEIAWNFIQRESVLPLHPPMESICREQVPQTESTDSRHSSGGKFVPSQKVQELRNKLIKFMEDHIYPMESEFYKLAQSSMC